MNISCIASEETGLIFLEQCLDHSQQSITLKPLFFHVKRKDLID